MRRTPKRPRSMALETLELRTLLSTVPATSVEPEVDRSILFVRWTADVSPARAERLADRLGATPVESYPGGPTIWSFQTDARRDRVAAWLSRQTSVVYAEADRPLAGLQFTPNDPSFGAQWGLNSRNNVDIDAPQAWSVVTASPSTVVAVIDTGIQLDHPDLVSAIYVNPREVANNGVDDDGNGFVDDVSGWNFVAETNNPSDDNGHGTHVSGIIAAAGNNAYGMTGVAFGAKILPLKILDSTGDGSTYDAVQAIYYALRMGARVINASWGGGPDSQALADAIRVAGVTPMPDGSTGAVFVVAAGNNGANNDLRGSVPARYRYANTISVAAVDSAGSLARYSNFGARTVDLAAPGSRILSTVPGGYGVLSGTSMAAPHVSGVVALLASRFPSSSAAQLVQRTVNTTKPLSTLAGRTIRGGLVDAYYAVTNTVTTQPRRVMRLFRSR